MEEENEERRKGQGKLQPRVNKQKRSQKTWRSSELMKKTRTQGRGRKGCESQLEGEKARKRGANRNPRTESIGDRREQEIYWKPSCFSLCIQCNSIPGRTLVSPSKRREGKSKLIGALHGLEPGALRRQIRGNMSLQLTLWQKIQRWRGSSITQSSISQKVGEAKTVRAGLQHWAPMCWISSTFNKHLQWLLSPERSGSTGIVENWELWNLSWRNSIPRSSTTDHEQII